MFANALRTTRSTFARLANGGSASPKNDAFARLAKGGSASLLARRSLGEGGGRRCDQHCCLKKIKKKLVIRSNI
jgi:hypothetical protein